MVLDDPLLVRIWRKMRRRYARWEKLIPYSYSTLTRRLDTVLTALGIADAFPLSGVRAGGGDLRVGLDATV